MIRRAKKEDISEIAVIENQCIEVAWSEKMLSDSYDSGDYDFFVSDDDGVVTAYGFVRWIIDEGDICNIATKEEFRNTGRASGILKIMEERAKERKVSKLFLEVSEINAAAISLYKKAGFSEIYRRANYYGVHAAVIMEKNI